MVPSKRRRLAGVSRFITSSPQCEDSAETGRVLDATFDPVRLQTDSKRRRLFDVSKFVTIALPSEVSAEAYRVRDATFDPGLAPIRFCDDEKQDRPAPECSRDAMFRKSADDARARLIDD
jgi:hypothetical protein